jgi:Toxin co-regulated pilus biosynthesis protein Q/Conjugal transfer protein
MRADSTPRFRGPPAFAQAFCAALLLAVGGNAMSLPGKRFLGRYDFGYAIRGDKAARPAQVFDDGAGKVYFEARPNRPMPAVFAGKDPTLLVMQPEGQYFTARTAASEFTLVLGGARAVVRRGDAALGDEVLLPQAPGGRQLASAEAGLSAGIDYGAPVPRSETLHEQPVVFPPASATLRPEVLEALSALLARIGPDAGITTVGRNDAGQPDALGTSRARALRNALLARGVAPQRITTADDAAPPPPGAGRSSALRWRTAATGGDPLPLAFEILASDGDIATTLRRWARASGYGIEWDVEWQAPVDGTVRLDAASFADAVRQVVAGLRAQGYPVQTRMTSDRQLRFSDTD